MWMGWIWWTWRGGWRGCRSSRKIRTNRDQNWMECSHESRTKMGITYRGGQTLFVLIILALILFGFTSGSTSFLYMAGFVFIFTALFWPSLFDYLRKKEEERESKIRKGLITYKCVNGHSFHPSTEHKYCTKCGGDLFFYEEKPPQKAIVECLHGHRFEKSDGYRFCPKCGSEIRNNT